MVFRTQSLWSFINSKRAIFLNPMYCAPLDDKVALFPVASIRFFVFLVKHLISF